MGARTLASIAVLIGCMAGATRSARAETPPCDPVAAARTMAEHRGLLEDQARRSRSWNAVWGIGYFVAAAGQFAFAAKPEWAPIDVDDDMQKGLYVGAVKSAIGSAARIVVPLRAIQPDFDVNDPCGGAAAAEAALRITARKQKTSFWLNHLGGLAVNLGGSLVLGLGYDAWGAAATSFAVGYPVGLLSTYTMPRGAWQELRERHALTVTVSPMGNGLAIAGTF